MPTRSPAVVGWRAQLGLLPALTICQPWAEAILVGSKRIETRTWLTSYRGPLALHAGRRWWHQSAQGIAEARREAERNAARLGLSLPITAYPRGALVGLAVVEEAFIFDAARWERERPTHGLDTRWEPGRCGWRLGTVRRLPAPIPYRGALGLFPIPAALAGLS